PHPPYSTFFPYTTLFRSQTVVGANDVIAFLFQIVLYELYDVSLIVYDQDLFFRQLPVLLERFKNLRWLPSYQGAPSAGDPVDMKDRKSTRLNSSHCPISY